MYTSTGIKHFYINPFDRCVQLVQILYIMGDMGDKSPSEVAAEKPAVYMLPLEPISET